MITILLPQIEYYLEYYLEKYRYRTMMSYQFSYFIL